MPPDRGPNGEPSATDFLILDLPSIVDAIATDSEGLPEVIEGVPSTRMVIGARLMVPSFVAYAVEGRDGSVDVIGIDLELSA